MDKVKYPKNLKEHELFNLLRLRVRVRIDAIPEDRSAYMKIKAIMMPLVYFGSFVLALFNSHKPLLYTGLFIIMGITLVLIYLNLIHEAAHNNIYKTKRYNQWVLHLFDLIGANSYMWKIRHIDSHHHYPNVDGWDTDIEQSGPIKIYPYAETKGAQKYQDKYIFFMYPFYLFNWMLVRDFKDFFSKDRIIYKIHGPIPMKEKLKMIIYKLFYLFYQIGVPVLFFRVSAGLAFAAWFLQIMIASIFALFVLLPLHPLPDNAFPIPDDKNVLPFGWMRHQLEVTNDLTHNNWFVRHILGNFNYHVAHHLFPNYSYPYYREITEEIEAFAKENYLTYKKFSLLKVLRKHYELLRLNAHNMPLHHVFEELDS